MLIKSFCFTLLTSALISGATQIAGAQTTRPARTTTTTTQTTETAPAETATPARSRRTTQTTTTSTTRASTAPRTTGEAATAGVRAAFDKLLDGIRESDIDKVMNVYLESPRLVVFNNNGTVTRGAANYRATREQIYARAKDVSLEVRDVDVKLLGRDGAVVSCRWTQEQTVGAATESATGRMTVVFQRVGTQWKAVHTHTSPDAPDPSRLLPSERTEIVPGATPSSTPTTRP